MAAPARPYLVAQSHPFCTHVRPSWLIFGIFAPTCCQKCPNIAPRLPNLPNIAQLMAKIAQDSPQEAPRHPPGPPISSQNAVVFFDFTLRPVFPKITPKIQKMIQDTSQNGAKMAISATWLQLVPKLAQIAHQEGVPARAKICQDSLKEPLQPRRPPGPPPRPPRPPSDLDFAWFWG